MPYAAPSTVSAGQTYASAAHNVIVNDIIDHESRLLTVQNTQYPFRNILLNGAMQVSQRATSVSGISAAALTYNTADRWQFGLSALGTWTNAISADAPTGSGFRNSFRMTATASAVTGTGSYAFITQRLEGQTLQHLKKGTSSAQQLTASFWVKSNKTGTYIAELVDNDNTRQVSAAYTINAVDTWENKTITFPADTTGVLDNDANDSLRLSFWLGAGTDYTSGSLNTSWNSLTTANRAVGQTNLAGVANQYFAITGVQLEPGNVASPYEFVLYQDELRRCHRYYYKPASTGNNTVFASGVAASTTSAYIFLNTPPLRTTAQSVDWSTLQVAVPGIAGPAVTALSVSSGNSSTQLTFLTATVASGLTSSARYELLQNSSTSAYLAVSAEL